MGLAAQRFSSGNVSFGTPTAKASYFRPVEALRRDEAQRRRAESGQVHRLCMRARAAEFSVALLGSTLCTRARLRAPLAAARSAARRLLHVSGLHPRASTRTGQPRALAAVFGFASAQKELETDASTFAESQS